MRFLAAAEYSAQPREEACLFAAVFVKIAADVLYAVFAYMEIFARLFVF